MTKSKLDRIFTAPIYPFLLAVYPTFSLLAYNLGEIRPAAAMRALVVSLLACAALFALFRVLLRDVHRAAFVTAVWVFLFFTFGHFQIILPAARWTQNDILLPIWTALALLPLIWAWRGRPGMRGLSAPLNVATLLLAGMSVWQFMTYDAEVSRMLETPVPADKIPAIHVDESAPMPDVYYFILDSYTRADTMQNIYGFDNSPFINELEAMGFYVAQCSQSNYDRTELSLPSSLSFNYLTDIEPSLTTHRKDKTPLWGHIRNNRIRATLEGLGYTTYAFATDFPWSEWEDADHYIQPQTKWSDLTQFETLAMDTTLLRALQTTGLFNYRDANNIRQRELTRGALSALSSMPEAEGPKFVFVHILDPHPLFVFDAQGNPLDGWQFINEIGKYTPESYGRGYIEEVQFINREVARVAKELIANSDVPPIIIIQGDHGPWFHEADTVLTILNAYYLPGHSDKLYPTISPVNSFRVVLNEFFGADLPLLDDVNYNSPHEEPFNYELVPNTCK